MTTDLAFKTSMEFRYGVPADMGCGVARLVAENPGPFTFKGTNTYLVGTKSLAVIDPGPEDAAHLAAILAAAQGRPITHILVTHTHRDHVDGYAALQAATGAVTVGFGGAKPSRGTLASSPSGTEFVDLEFTPDLHAETGTRITGEDWEIGAIHTPGHAPDHLCFTLSGTAMLFSGDHVMAWNTSVVAPPEGRMADYLASLQLLLERPETLYLPGHGGRIEDGLRMSKAYLLHRRWREQAILGAIRSGHDSIDSIVALVYQGLDPKLEKAAALAVLGHVEHLIERGLVAADGAASLRSRLSPL
jgi:glyoxylase-like metal-dependent hydrolase (beta-lactamase superfamily II)